MRRNSTSGLIEVNAAGPSAREDEAVNHVGDAIVATSSGSGGLPVACPLGLVPVQLNRQIVPKVRPSLLRALPWLILIVAVGVSLAIWESNRMRTRDLVRVEFESLVTRLSDSIQRRMVANEQVLRSVEGLFDASEGVSRQEFHNFVAAQHLLIFP